jgi:hypothetical protein
MTFTVLELPQKMEIASRTVKFFEKYQKKVEILIVHHEDFSCLEVIVLGMKLGNKASRRYLNSCLLVPKIDINQFNSTLIIKQSSAVRQNKPFDSKIEMKKIATNMILAYVINSLQVVPSIEDNEFEFYFKPNLNDNAIINLNSCEFYARLDYEFEKKPRGLKPFDVVYTLNDIKKATFGVTSGSQKTVDSLSSDCSTTEKSINSQNSATSTLKTQQTKQNTIKKQIQSYKTSTQSYYLTPKNMLKHLYFGFDNHKRRNKVYIDSDEAQ